MVSGVYIYIMYEMFGSHNIVNNRKITLQENSRIWIWIFSDRKTGILPKIFKEKLTHGFASSTGKIGLLKIKGCTRAVVGCCYNLLACVANFELGGHPSNNRIWLLNQVTLHL